MIRRLVLLTATGLSLTASAILAQQQDDASAAVFQRYADRTAKIQVVERGSGAKASMGSAFFVASDGRLMTNYHVVAEAVGNPRYRVEWIDQTGIPHIGRILAIDVVRDLAVVGTDRPRDRYFTLSVPFVARGTRLYSLGHPEDLGLSIVEGVYNGHLQHTLYPKIHYTGPLNSGMSGGPALTANGQVVGVNVATAGNSLSFLVPIEAAIPLMARSEEAAATTESGDFIAEVGRQVLANQGAYLGTLFQGNDSTIAIGPFILPTQPASFFRCWADAERNPDALYEVVDHQCSTDDYIYLSGRQSSGIVSLSHRVLLSRGLNPIRFYSLYTAEFQSSYAELGFGSSADLTSYQCSAGNIRQPGGVIRTRFCLRGYTKYPGLYDAVIKAAMLGARDAGVVSQLTLSGVSFDNAQRLGRQYLEQIRWSR
ncbi:MAG: trypsin-like peptidase domain-containing protein [Gemmatimonadales bacterium]|nr:trypsin-like peptidase domain-containing protein [Gemmatimonadales bacterium]